MNRIQIPLRREYWASLGGGCQVAYQLRRFGLRSTPSPLDWIRTPVVSVASIIESDFANFLKPANLRIVPSSSGQTLVDAYYGIVLPHDLDVYRESGSEGIQQRYAPRIERLRRALDAGAVLVRRRALTAEKDLLLSSLRQRSPNSHLVVINDDENYSNTTTECQHFAGLTIVKSAPMTAHWQGSDSTWSEIINLIADRPQVLHRTVLAELNSTSRTMLARALGNDWKLAANEIEHLLTWKGRVLESCSSNLVLALVAAEDHRFFDHSGIDRVALARALLGVLSRRKKGGGSTIEQQLFRTLCNQREPSLRRKARELAGATLLSSCLSKDMTARLYLSVAYFGANMNGIEQACSRLGHALERVSIEDAAYIVAHLKYPRPMRPKPRHVESIGARARYTMQRLDTSHTNESV